MARDAKFWDAIEAYNALPASERAGELKRLGIEIDDEAVLGILTKSHFVVPGKTRFACQGCGECCRYARKVAQLTYEPCPFLTAENRCAKHDDRYWVCRWFPFWLYRDPVRGNLLTIKPYCSGYGKGPLVDYQEVQARLLDLATKEAQEGDGAFVIHEVLLVPGRKDWAFPSKDNVDDLMHQIRLRAQGAKPVAPVERPLERPGEVHYAHHFTSGLLGSQNAPLLTVDEDGHITDVNETTRELFGRDRHALVGKHLASFFVNPDRVTTGLATCFLHGKETASAQRLRLPDEATVPVLLNGLTFRDRGDGLVHGLLLGINPVSAMVWNQVNQSRNYARGLLEASLDALFVIDLDGVITDLNQAVVDLTGRERSALLGSPFRDLFVCRDKAIEGVDRTFKTGTVRNYELTLFGVNEQKIPVSFNAAVYKDSEGVVQGVFAAARDIRERLKMVRELEEAKNYARGLIECCIDLMVTINHDGLITDANHAAVTMTGQSKEALIGSPFKDLFDDPTRAQVGVDAAFVSGEVRRYTLNLLSDRRRPVPVAFNATLYRDSAGIVQGVFAIARVRDEVASGTAP